MWPFKRADPRDAELALANARVKDCELRLRQCGDRIRQLLATVRRQADTEPHLCICRYSRWKLFRQGATHGPDGEVGTPDDLPTPPEDPRLCYCGEKWYYELRREDLGEDGLPNTTDDDPTPTFWGVA